jgi:hypothetical protein
MKYKLTFRDSTLGPASDVEFPDFSDELWELLAAFMSYSDDAHRTRFARELQNYKRSFHFANSGAVRSTGIVPDDEALSTFLHRYRPIILPSEPTEFTQVCSRLVRHVSHPIFTKLVGIWREQYSGKPIREMMSIQQGDLAPLGEAFLQQYLNAYEYHRDRKKRQRLAAFAQTFEPDARIGLITLLLTWKFCAVSNLLEFVRELRTLKDQRKEGANNTSESCR